MLESFPTWANRSQKYVLYGNFLKFIGVDVHQGVQRVSR